MMALSVTKGLSLTKITRQPSFSIFYFSFWAQWILSSYLSLWAQHKDYYYCYNFMPRPPPPVSATACNCNSHHQSPPPCAQCVRIYFKKNYIYMYKLHFFFHFQYVFILKYNFFNHFQCIFIFKYYIFCLINLKY